jgi:hypothetical protein
VASAQGSDVGAAASRRAAGASNIEEIEPSWAGRRSGVGRGSPRPVWAATGGGGPGESEVGPADGRGRLSGASESEPSGVWQRRHRGEGLGEGDEEAVATAGPPAMAAQRRMEDVAARGDRLIEI